MIGVLEVENDIFYQESHFFTRNRLDILAFLYYLILNNTWIKF